MKKQLISADLSNLEQFSCVLTPSESKMGSIWATRLIKININAFRALIVCFGTNKHAYIAKICQTGEKIPI